MTREEVTVQLGVDASTMRPGIAAAKREVSELREGLNKALATFTPGKIIEHEVRGLGRILLGFVSGFVLGFVTELIGKIIPMLTEALYHEKKLTDEGKALDERLAKINLTVAERKKLEQELAELDAKHAYDAKSTAGQAFEHLQTYRRLTNEILKMRRDGITDEEKRLKLAQLELEARKQLYLYEGLQNKINKDRKPPTPMIPKTPRGDTPIPQDMVTDANRATADRIAQLEADAAQSRFGNRTRAATDLKIASDLRRQLIGDMARQKHGPPLTPGEKVLQDIWNLLDPKSESGIPVVVKNVD